MFYVLQTPATEFETKKDALAFCRTLDMATIASVIRGKEVPLKFAITFASAPRKTSPAVVLPDIVDIDDDTGHGDNHPAYSFTPAIPKTKRIVGGRKK